jgi:hypothetical protein
MDTNNLEKPVVENVVDETGVVEPLVESVAETPFAETPLVAEPPTLIDTAIPESFIENHIDPAISESFIKELFIENTNIETVNDKKVNDEMINIEMVDIKSSVVETLVVENPVVENPIVLDEIDISNENQLQVVIQVSNVDTSVHDTSVHDTSVHDTNLENTIETKKGIDQDTLQRINVGVQVCLELYRVITSSLLILFVPQICDDHICSTTENLVWETNAYNTALCFNFISMAFLVNMYYMELVRENRLIKYLGINPQLANNNEEVGKRLELLSIHKQNKIFTINKYYRISSYGALSIYVLNVLLSIAAINKYYAGSQTTSTFITYVLFMATKFASVYSLISTDKNIFYSAYIKANVQFNDIDDDCKKV